MRIPFRFSDVDEYYVPAFFPSLFFASLPCAAANSSSCVHPAAAFRQFSGSLDYQGPSLTGDRNSQIRVQRQGTDFTRSRQCPIL